MLHNFNARLLFKIITALGAVLIIAAILIYLGADIAGKSDFISKILSENSARNKAVNDLVKIKESAKGSEAMFDKLNNALPEKDDLFLVLREISATAKQFNLGFTAPRFGAEIPPSEMEPGRIIFAMTAQGDYNNLIGFIKELETNKRFLNLTSADIIRQGVRYNAVLSGELYFK